MTMRVVSCVVLTLSLVGCSDQTAQSDKPPAAPFTASTGVAVVAGTATPGTIVTLEPTVARGLAPPAQPRLMDQFGQQFLPDLLTASVGQQVEFRSSEDVLHNVRVDHIDSKETVFNVATPSFGSYTHVFDKPGYYRVSCDVHPAMRANIFVSATPYAAVADNRGSFTVADVQTGSYTVRSMKGDQMSERVVNVISPRTELSLGGR